MQTYVAIIALLAVSSVANEESPLEFFSIFPHIDSRQHTVYDATVFQVVGTVDSAALERELEMAGDLSWQPLRIHQDPSANSSDSARALFSIGLANFSKTSAGHYGELAFAFPACRSSFALELGCTSFMHCHDRLPDCAFTYMYRSYVSTAAAREKLQEAGTDAVVTPGFMATTQDLPMGTQLSFRVATEPEGETILEGTAELPPEFPTPELASGRNYNFQKFVGPPGILGPGNAQHLCVFPSNLAAGPARLAELALGPYLRHLNFIEEGALHLASFRFVRLPPWGAAGTALPTAAAAVSQRAHEGGHPAALDETLRNKAGAGSGDIGSTADGLSPMDATTILRDGNPAMPLSDDASDSEESRDRPAQTAKRRPAKSPSTQASPDVKIAWNRQEDL